MARRLAVRFVFLCLDVEAVRRQLALERAEADVLDVEGMCRNAYPE